RSWTRAAIRDLQRARAARDRGPDGAGADGGRGRGGDPKHAGGADRGHGPGVAALREGRPAMTGGVRVRATGRWRWIAALALVGGVLAQARDAAAEIRRIAVVVGSNHGDGAHAPLRFAEQDAAKLSAVLGELGGLQPGDLVLLRGPTLEDVRAA